MAFQLILDAVVLFLVVWMYFKFILPLLYKKPRKTDEGSAPSVVKKKRDLAEAVVKLRSQQREVLLTRELKEVLVKKQEVQTELKKEDDDLSKIT